MANARDSAMLSARALLGFGRQSNMCSILVRVVIGRRYRPVRNGAAAKKDRKLRQLGDDELFRRGVDQLF
ncbi:hypothetical protein Phou_092140 [Phytohabitans houttuyneae]|uniref:Uncharacterized protein n=1 Tax=Phytohabitans houttuyneae TaxID=1076126 RepID=A0A6V8KMF3_9ACTN|nr:hypothetical protein Phou_092140 [Phytohabitans houttuyneae]